MCSWLVHYLFRTCSGPMLMTCSNLLYSVFKTCPWLVHNISMIANDLFITYSQFSSNLFLTCSLCSWLVHTLFTTWLLHLLITLSWLLHNLVMVYLTIFFYSEHYLLNALQTFFLLNVIFSLFECQQKQHFNWKISTFRSRSSMERPGCK